MSFSDKTLAFQGVTIVLESILEVAKEIFS